MAVQKHYWFLFFTVLIPLEEFFYKKTKNINYLVSKKKRLKTDRHKASNMHRNIQNIISIGWQLIHRRSRSVCTNRTDFQVSDNLVTSLPPRWSPSGCSAPRPQACTEQSPSRCGPVPRQSQSPVPCRYNSRWCRPACFGCPSLRHGRFEVGTFCFLLRSHS